ncbi:M4 family metallopeptidase [Macrococcoides caseolyticum]|uniref:M4 family metallopeptidase n=1 Tax=Macrococcoides caseolyticum TaxID=69966 RepID=UPI001F372AE4|nr:M4 family metallopeptidase [Macrococcus caseolyticus]MCE4957431.1 peptidase M4 family protein [Macrococcus caseolyticus]
MNKKQFVTTLLSTSLIVSLVPHTTFAKTESGKSLHHLQKVQTKIDAKNFLKSLPGDKAAKKFYKQYEITKVEKDEQGFTHYTLKPHNNGKKALNKEIKIHVNDKNEVVHVNGELDQKQVLPTNTQTLSKDQAIDLAFKAVNADKNKVKNIDNRKVVKKAEVAINADKNKYVYDIQLIYVTPKAANWKVQIDAETGEVIKKQNMLFDAATTGYGYGVDNKFKPLNIYQEGSYYYLADMTHNGNIETYDAFNTQTNLEIVRDTDKYFTSSRQKAAVDAHYYGDIVYDYYKNTHNRDSYDGNGAPIYSVVHYGQNYNNAFWNGEAMVYGDGDGRTFTSLSGANDIIAHELTHAVTEYTAGLIYENQPGAINESMSDVFGYFVDPDFLMGEDVYTPGVPGDALRSFDQPELYDQPSHMDDYQYLPNTENGDWGGVHINSGIPNKAFYNTVTKIGKAKSEQIYYRALSYYLTSTSDFKDTKEALIQSAQDLYGQTEADTINAAWEAVGVY